MTPDREGRDALVKLLSDVWFSMTECTYPTRAIRDRADEVRERVEALRSTLSQPAGEQEAAHPDDVAVDEFAAEMKLKLARKRAEGRGGWDDPKQCAVEFLYRLLWNHEKREGQHIDVANLRMMIWHRERALANGSQQPGREG